MFIYISGKITNNDNYYQDFTTAKKELMAAGFPEEQIKNPIEIIPYKGLKTWKHYMISDIATLIKCDAIYMLKGWRRSKGARLERHLAKKLDLLIMYQR